MVIETISLCFISDFPSIKEGIQSITNISSSALKKYKLNKNFLNKRVLKKDEIELDINIINYNRVNPKYSSTKPIILFEDKNFVVLSKPTKVHSHPLSYNESDNLLSYIRENNICLLEVNKNQMDRGLLYRLDYETSGLIYYIKNNEIYDELRSSFKTIVKEKFYYAIVEGDLNDQQAIHCLKTSSTKGSIVIEHALGKKCKIHIKKVEYNPKLDVSLVQIRLFEGFKHQIRVQLSLIGHPIWGDPIYGDRNSSRLWLHCYQYIFNYQGHRYDTCDKSETLESFFSYFDSKL